jgi:hypothetical protein
MDVPPPSRASSEGGGMGVEVVCPLLSFLFHT